MKALEGMAHDLFLKFAIKETGKPANWAYLSDERKLEWMKEVMIMADHYLTAFQKQIKPLPLPTSARPQTSYESGFYQGQVSERSNFYRILETTHEDLINELKDFQASIKK